MLSKVFEKLMLKDCNSSKCRFLFQCLYEHSLQTDSITLHRRMKACIDGKGFAGLLRIKAKLLKQLIAISY